MTQSTSKTRAARNGRFSRLGLGLASMGALFASGCLERPVAKVNPFQQSVFVDPLVNSAVDKIDILFVVDNSRSMADKQVVLREAVPLLLDRLVDPWCIDGNGSISRRTGNSCPDGTAPEFDAIDDIHIGVITSSLGIQGGNSDHCKAEEEDDEAYLLPIARGKVPIANVADFISWAPGSDKATTVQQFQSLVAAAGETGCGFEATMESWYRFLIDPEPGAQRVAIPCNSAEEESGKANCIAEQGVDQSVLDQRAAFLRPDSLVAIIQLSDENDCSVSANKSLGHWTTSKSILGKSTMPMASSVCATNPNDPCCHTCAVNPPAECGVDAACEGTPRHTTEADQMNLRCWNQKERFGIELLYPTSRYIQGLTEYQVPNQAGELVNNPLYFSDPDDTAHTRDRGLVFLAGIVGVPWQDIARDPEAPRLSYMSAQELRNTGRWTDVLGEPEASPPVPPTNPLMIEAVAARSGVPVYSGTPNGVNGGERPIDSGDDLQYACIFDLQQTRDCAASASSSCDCNGAPESPLCQGTTQVAAKAYPGTRFLEVLKGFADEQFKKTANQIGENNSIVASICPKEYAGGNPDSDTYGYTPAVAAIIERLKQALSGSCLPRPLSVGADGSVPCDVVEAYPAGDAGCGECLEAEGRFDVESRTLSAVQRNLEDDEYCVGDDCKKQWCFCAIQQITDPASGCMTESIEENISQEGWCYIDKEIHEEQAQQQVLSELGCTGVNPQVLRIVGEKKSGAVTLVACQLKSE